MHLDQPRETAPLDNPQAYHAARKDARRTVEWTEAGLHITRLRLLSEPGYDRYDVSYCHGYIGNEPVNVSLPFSDLPRTGLTACIVRWAKLQGVYAHGLGILANLSCLR